MPVAVGLKATLTVQFDPPARLDPQVLLVIGNSAFDPVTVMLVRVTDELLSLVIVTLNEGLVVPTETDPKFSADGDTVSATPVPVRLAVCGLPKASSVIDNVPAIVPPCVGTNCTLTWHEAPEASVLPQASLPVTGTSA